VPVITPMMGEAVALRQPQLGSAWWRALREPVKLRTAEASAPG